MVRWTSSLGRLDEEAIRWDPNYGVVTPEECIELANSLGPDGTLCSILGSAVWIRSSPGRVRHFERKVLSQLDAGPCP